MDPAHISRLKEEQEHAYLDTQAKIQQWKKFDDDYNSLQDRLKTLPDKVTHSVMVPFGPLAFMPGQIVHTNEITVLLGDNWFAERSAKQAYEIVDRRKKQIQTMLTELEEQQRLLGDRLGFTTEFKELSENKEDIVEIQEEYDPEKERLWREERKKKKPGIARSEQQKATGSKDSIKTKEKTASKDPTRTVTPKVAPPTSRANKTVTVKDAEVKTNKRTVDTQSQGATGSGQSSQVIAGENKEETQGRREMTAEEELWARLDELERQEEELDELALLSDYEEDEEYENRPMFSYVQENIEEEPSPQPKEQRQQDKLTRSDSAEKRVQWKDQQQQQESSGSSTEEEEEVPRPATIHFTHTKANAHKEANPSEGSELTSPADIYKQYLARQSPSEDSEPAEKSVTTEPSLKSIMKPARVEPVVEKPAKQILPQLDSVFSGNIVERQYVTMATPADNQPMTDKPAKRVSKFKAARQQKR